MFRDKRKPISVVSKNVTLSAKLFFLTMEPYKKYLGTPTVTGLHADNLSTPNVTPV